MKNKNMKSKYVIVGTGPASLVLANELVNNGQTVTILESGDEDSFRSDLSNSISYGHYSGSYWNAHWLHTYGGTSRVWAGWIAPLDEMDLNPGNGHKWPLAYSGLNKYYRAANSYLDRDEGLDSLWQSPENCLIDGFDSKPFSVQPPTRFNLKFKKLPDSPAVDIIFNSSVIAINLDENRKKVKSIRVFDHEKSHHVLMELSEGQILILAAGGIGNAQLLLQPSDDGMPVLPWNTNVGEYLMEHPHFYSCAELVLFKDLKHILGVTPQNGVVPAIQLNKNERSVNKGNQVSIELSSADLVGAEIDYYRSMYPELGTFKLNIRSEMQPVKRNKVELSNEKDISGLFRPRVHCSLDAEDFDVALNALMLMSKKLVDQNLGRLKINNEAIYAGVRGGGHTMGTTRMGLSESDSVVDKDLKVHGLSNLYITGSSVFTTGGAANPTYTICALSIRLAGHLLTRLV